MPKNTTAVLPPSMPSAHSRFFVVRPKHLAGTDTSDLATSLPEEKPAVAAAVSLLLKTVLEEAQHKACNIDKALVAFSSENGIAKLASEKNAQTTELTVFRNWMDWQAITEAMNAKKLSDSSVSSGEAQFIFGGLFCSLNPSLGCLAKKSFKTNDRWLSLRSGLCEKSLSSPAVRLLLSLAQDIYLSETADMDLKAPQKLSVIHGLGLPLTFINSTLLSAEGLTDQNATPASLLSNELNLLQALLFRLTHQVEAAADLEKLCAVLPKPLVDFVAYLKERGLANRATDADALFISFLFDRTRGFIGSPVSIRYMEKRIRNTLLELSALSASTDLLKDRSAFVLNALDTNSFLNQILKALSQFQHEIRYQEDGCKMPEAGTERAYLNSIVRNWVCKILNFHLPAEIAQFDLLLRANRSGVNMYFNDYSRNGALVEHLSNVATTGEGSDSLITQVLSILTRHFERDAMRSEALFVFDEPGPNFVLPKKG